MGESVPTVNRVATVVEPREPYLAWARGLDDDEPTIDSLSHEVLTSVYLIAFEEHPERSLRRNWDWMFEHKLHAWCRDATTWPPKRTYRMFREWYDVRLVDLIFDLADEPLLQED